ncbi:MAG: DUF523 domain-containing protein [Nitrospirae bacterium]|nr:DUF523 domain-containing protein [Nitrospirota bacterium]
MVIVSACLAGLNTRYDGGNRADERVVALVRAGKAVPVCPEQLGGLPTPRSKAEISSGDGRDVLSGRAVVLSEDGSDLTGHFMKGAAEVLRLARMMNAEEAVLKDGSPSCGVNHIKREGEETVGMGVLAALLSLNGLKVRSNDPL